MILINTWIELRVEKNIFFLLLSSNNQQSAKNIERCRILYDLLQKMSVIFRFSSINQAKTHKYEFKHFIYENKEGFDGINPN